MNLLLIDSKFVDFYTYLDPIFGAAPELVEFTYLISDLETGGGTDGRLSRGPIVISGLELQSTVEREKVQFIWGVFSAFDHEPRIPETGPFADGNPEFWHGSPVPQMSGAKFEIVCWDSSATLFIGVAESIAENLRRKYPDIHDLDEYNRQEGLPGFQ